MLKHFNSISIPHQWHLLIISWMYLLSFLHMFPLYFITKILTSILLTLSYPSAFLAFTSLSANSCLNFLNWELWRTIKLLLSFLQSRSIWEFRFVKGEGVHLEILDFGVDWVKDMWSLVGLWEVDWEVERSGILKVIPGFVRERIEFSLFEDGDIFKTYIDINSVIM